MKMQWQLPALIFSMGLSALWLQSGCESTSSPDTNGVDSYFANHPYVSDPRNPTTPSDVSITPANATATYVGQAISFTAKGGSGSYHWDVVNGNGHIASVSDDHSTAVYSVDGIAANTVVVYDEYGLSAIASVGTSAASSVLISPTSGTCANNGDVLTFAASGGSPPYTWTVLNGHGSLNTFTGASVLYTRISAGSNGLTVSDSMGNTYSVVITQP